MSNFSLQIGDGTVKNGNARGSDSIDLQLLRAAATQVASGAGSMIVGGGANTASGLYSAVIGGYGNISSGVYSVSGGNGNTASGQASVSLGAGNLASGAGAACLGLENQATAAASIAIGYGNIVAGANAAAINSSASAIASTAPYATIIGGAGAAAYLPGQLVTNARSQYGAGGNFQVSEIIVMAESPQTAGSAQAVFLTLDGGPASPTNQIFMNSTNKVWQIVSDWMLIDTVNNMMVSGKDIVIAHKRNGSMRAVYRTKIAETGDASMVSGWETAYGPAQDLSVAITPIGLTLGAPTIFRATAKLTITEIKSN
jgi:hypothetical protein